MVSSHVSIEWQYSVVDKIEKKEDNKTWGEPRQILGDRAEGDRAVCIYEEYVMCSKEQ